MIYLISSFIMLIKTWSKNSISNIAFGLLFASSICAYMVGRQPQMEFDTQLYSLYIVVLLCFLLYASKNYSDLRTYNFSMINRNKLRKIEICLSLFGLLTILLYLYILSKVFELLLLEEIAVQEYKNEGGAEEIFNTLVPHSLITLGNFMSPFGYIFLSLHFYYLIHNNIKKSLFFLFLSSSLIMNGLIALSRSSTTTYLLCYGTILYFLFPLLERKLKRTIVKWGSIFGLLIFSALFIISESRFSEYYTKQSLNEAILDEKEYPLLFSVFDYFSQWEERGPCILKNYHFGDQSWSLYNSNGLGVHIQKVIYGGAHVNEMREKKYRRLLGDNISSFHGLIARGVFDYGFIGNFFFIVLIVQIVRRLEPKNGIIEFKTLFFLPLIIPFILTFWSGNALANIPYDLGVIYNTIIYKFVKKRICQ